MKEKGYTKENYDSPEIYVVEISIEKGFAASGENFGNGGGFNYDYE